jgi:hypothetical protein
MTQINTDYTDRRNGEDLRGLTTEQTERTEDVCKSKKGAAEISAAP